MIPLKVKEYISGETILKSTPKVLNIELTNFCNLHCPVCVAKNTREQGFLSLDLLKEVLAKNKKTFEGQFIWLHFNGEPLLHPFVSEIIQILKRHGVKTRLSTNGTLLDEENALKLMQAGLDYIVFSVDGVKKETYEKMRKGANFEQVERNILNFLKIKKERGFGTKTQIQIIRTKLTEDEIKPFIQKWKKMDINYINVKSFCSRGGRIAKTKEFVKVSRLENRIKNRQPCFYLWETLIILWNGDVITCCQDLLGELKVGNIKESSLLEIWNNPILVNLRKEQSTGKFLTNPCRQCPDWKGFPRNYFYYLSDSLWRAALKRVLRHEKKDEGINIIFNHK